MYPKVRWSKKKLVHNVHQLMNMCEKESVTCSIVTKGFSANETLVEVLLESGVTHVSDARLDNIERIRSIASDVHTQLIRLPPMSDLDRVIAYVDRCPLTSIDVARVLNERATQAGIVQDVYVFVEMGDRREGILPEEVLPFVRQLVTFSSLRLVGVATNLTCYGGIIPKEETMEAFVRIAEDVERRLGLTLDVLSGGSSSAIPLVLEGHLPDRINELRLGEVYLFGREAAYGERVPGFANDIFTLEAEVVEVMKKPSLPEGETGGRTFGHCDTVYEDLGDRWRALLAVGAQDVDFTGIRPHDERLTMLATCSDYLIADVTDMDAVSVGDILSFDVTYEALLQLSTSSYVTFEQSE